jgi:hypothetical protein
MFADTAVTIVSATAICPSPRRDYCGRLKTAERRTVEVVQYVVLAGIERILYIRG